MSPELALRLEIYLGEPAEFWLECGTKYELAICRIGQEEMLRVLIQPYFI